MKNFKQGFAPLLIIILVALVVGGGAYYVSKKSEAPGQVKKESSAQTPTSTQNNIERATTTNSNKDSKPVTIKATTTLKVTPAVLKKGIYVINQSNGQVIYKTDEYGFEFTIPSTFILQPEIDYNVIRNHAVVSKVIFSSKGSKNDRINIYLGKKVDIQKEGVIESYPIGDITYVEPNWDVKVGDRNGQIFYAAGDICTPSQNIQFDVKDSSSKTQNAVISFWGGNCADQNATIDSSVINSILASFKFTR